MIDAPQLTQSPVLFGVGVSKRYFKKAADRNRIKRLTREVYRTMQHQLNALIAAKNLQLHLFFIFTGKELPLFADCATGMAIALEKLTKTLAKKA
jgi:ribonuclease P protein component